MSKKNSLSECHPEKALYAKGLCRSCYEKQLRETNPEYYQRQKENCAGRVKKFTARKRQVDKKWLAKQDKTYRRGVMLKSKFGISLDDYEQMLAKQGGVCGICSKPSSKNLHVDHCHTTGRIRGLLCFRCNFGLSFFKDGLLIDNACKYLQVKGTA